MPGSGIAGSYGNSIFSFLSFFLMCMPLISFSWFIALARTSRTLLTGSGESRCPRLASDLRGNPFGLSPLRIMLAVVSADPFTGLKKLSLFFLLYSYTPDSSF